MCVWSAALCNEKQIVTRRDEADGEYTQRKRLIERVSLKEGVSVTIKNRRRFPVLRANERPIPQRERETILPTSKTSFTLATRVLYAPLASSFVLYRALNLSLVLAPSLFLYLSLPFSLTQTHPTAAHTSRREYLKRTEGATRTHTHTHARTHTYTSVSVYLADCQKEREKEKEREWEGGGGERARQKRDKACDTLWLQSEDSRIWYQRTRRDGLCV